MQCQRPTCKSLGRIRISLLSCLPQYKGRYGFAHSVHDKAAAFSTTAVVPVATTQKLGRGPLQARQQCVSVQHQLTYSNT